MTLDERNKKVEENLALVTFSLQKLGVKFDEDYFQQGVLELIRCVECFDHSRRTKFSTYAVKNITLKLKEYIARDKVLKPKRTGEKGRVYAPECISLQKPTNAGTEDKELEFGDLIAVEDDGLSLSEILMDLESLVEKNIITKKELDIVKRIILSNETKLDVAKRYKESRSCIDKLYGEAIKKIKNNLSYNNE